jgi:hypothetical protein
VAGAGRLHLALSGFAKRLARYLNDTGNDLNNPDAVMQYRAVRLIRPENGGTATIVGLEASAAVPLGGVARVLRHVALAGDLTMLHSAVRLNNPALDRVERTQYAPASNLLLRLHYDDGRISADAACRLTGAYIQEYGSKCRPLPAPRRFRAARSTPGCGPRAKSTWPWRASGARTHCASRCAMRSTTPPIAPRSAARAMPCRRPSWAGGKCC